MKKKFGCILTMLIFLGCTLMFWVLSDLKIVEKELEGINSDIKIGFSFLYLGIELLFSYCCGWKNKKSVNLLIAGILPISYLIAYSYHPFIGIFSFWMTPFLPILDFVHFTQYFYINSFLLEFFFLCFFSGIHFFIWLLGRKSNKIYNNSHKICI